MRDRALCATASAYRPFCRLLPSVLPDVAKPTVHKHPAYLSQAPLESACDFNVKQALVARFEEEMGPALSGLRRTDDSARNSMKFA